MNLNTVKSYHLINIKRTMCEMLAYALIVGMFVIAYQIGLYFTWYSNQYEDVVYMAYLSAVVLPMVDYIATYYFNRFQYAYVTFDGDKIKIRSSIIFENSGTEEKVINSDQIESVSLEYKYLPCFERMVVRYNGRTLYVYKKDFMAILGF